MTSMLKLGRMDSLDSRARRKPKEWRSRSSGVPVQPRRVRMAAGTMTSWAEEDDPSVTVTRKWPLPRGTMPSSVMAGLSRR